MEGLKVMVGDQIKVPERRRFDPDELCMFIVYLIKEKKTIFYI
jgi:hypothetical protein